MRRKGTDAANLNADRRKVCEAAKGVRDQCFRTIAQGIGIFQKFS